MNVLRMVSVAMVVVFGLHLGVAAEEETKEMRTLKLQLRQADLARTQADTYLKQAEASFHESQTLFQKGLVSKKELADAEETYNKARMGLEQASIDLEKTRLTFLKDALHVTLEKAALYRDQQGEKHALLRIKNNANIRKIIDENGSYSNDEKRALLTIQDLTVRIMKDGSLIGRPFELKVAELPYQASRDIDFVLQRETEDVIVQIAYGDTVVQMPVYLEREAKEDRVQLDASQFSQEGELGTRVTFELEAERFVDDDKAFSLSVLNLPADYTYEFREHGAEAGANSGDSRVSRVRFKKGVTTKPIEFVIDMPKEIAKDQLNQKLSFFVLMLDRFAQQRLADRKSAAQGRALTSEDLDSAGVSYEALELVPRGRAEVTISASNFFTKVKLGEMIKYSFTLQNTGTVGLDRLRVEVTLPMDWSANITPEKDIVLDVDAKQKVDVEIAPAVDVVAGEYEATIKATTMHEGRVVEATPKAVRIQIEGKSNFLIGAILMIVLIGMIVGVAVMTIKISRR